MTEQEAEALAERLTRIWKPEQISEADLCSNNFRWCSKLNNDINLLVQENPDGLWVRLVSRVGYLTYDAGHLIERDSLVPRNDRGLRLQAEFANEWLPFFRRNCWLSGCDIQDSAHEKAEWIQGFSAEELEAWNLKT